MPAHHFFVSVICAFQCSRPVGIGIEIELIETPRPQSQQQLFADGNTTVELLHSRPGIFRVVAPGEGKLPVVFFGVGKHHQCDARRRPVVVMSMTWEGSQEGQSRFWDMGRKQGKEFVDEMEGKKKPGREVEGRKLIDNGGSADRHFWFERGCQELAMTSVLWPQAKGQTGHSMNRACDKGCCYLLCC